MSLMQFEPFRDPFRAVDRLTSQLLSGTRAPLGMPMDVWREDQTYRVALDLPGVDPSTVEVQVERNTLTVRAERQPQFGQDAQVLVAERPQGTFTRQLALGEGLDTEGVQADYSDGVLHLTIPVAQTAQPRRIQVGQRAGSQGSPQVIEGQSGSSEQSAS